MYSVTCLTIEIANVNSINTDVNFLLSLQIFELLQDFWHFFSRRSKPDSQITLPNSDNEDIVLATAGNKLK